MKTKAKTKTFGIISGAGPMAGALLYQQIIVSLQAQGAWKDADFPSIVLMNIPFGDMLDNNYHYNLVRKQLLTSLEQLHNLTDYIYIACQTLHAFLSSEEIMHYRVISLLELLKVKVAETNQPVWVAASNTSRRLKLHTDLHTSGVHYFCPHESDHAIQTIMRGLKPDLSWLIEKTLQHNVVLGCTEFSVSCQHMSYEWIDPIKLAAQDIIKKYCA